MFTINRHELRVRIWEKGAGLRGSYEQHKKRWQEDGDRPVGLMQFVNGPKPYDTGATGEVNVEALGYSSGRQSSWATASAGRSKTAYGTCSTSWRPRLLRRRSAASPKSERRPNGSDSGSKRWSARSCVWLKTTE